MKESILISRISMLGLVLWFTMSSAAACGEDTRAQAIEFQGRQFAVYALSRGRGVPEPARQALDQFRSIFAELHREGKVTRIEDVRIGLEGETRLCAEFATAEAALSAWKQASRLVEEIDLINLSAETCIGK